MSEKTLMEDLMALAPDPKDKKHTKIARLRSLMPGIEVALDRGASHDDILEKLKSHGFEISKSTFQTCLSRIRKKEQRDRPRKVTQPVATREVITSSRSENETRGMPPAQAALEQAKQEAKEKKTNFAKTMQAHIRTNKEKP